EDDRSPERTSSGRIYLLPRKGRPENRSLAARSPSKWIKTRPRFRRCIVSGTTRKHANEAATALQHPRWTFAHSYLRATPRRTCLAGPTAEKPGFFAC